MNRLLIFLFVIFTVLIITEQRIVKYKTQENLLRSGIRTLRPIPDGETTEIVAQASDGRSWRYVKIDSIWRYPNYHNAYVEPRRIKHVLNSLTKATASIVSTESGDLHHYQLLPNSPVITLFGEKSETLLSVRLGRGAPEARASESYVQLAGADTIYHLHANAAHAFDAGDPPLLDKHVWPRALKSQPFERVVFDSSHEVRALYRQLDDSYSPEVKQGIPQIPNYIWRIDVENGGFNCNPESAYAYITFLQRLKWAQLHDFKINSTKFRNARSIKLYSAAGHVETLDIASTKTEQHLLRSRSTGQVFTITNPKAKLLYPKKRALIDSLPVPNPYEKIEPRTSF
tara:strand:- start:836 stop:1864 length:1029 start_codon:yes stop_codon:yes gene_type:complete